MSLHEVVVEGTLRPDGALELDEKPNLTPGRVTVILRPVSAGPGGDSFWQRMQAIWDAQASAGRTLPSAGPSASEARTEWEDRQAAIERLQDECRAARESPGGGGR
jgi:hypothetical protein